MGEGNGQVAVFCLFLLLLFWFGLVFACIEKKGKVATRKRDAAAAIEIEWVLNSFIIIVINNIDRRSMWNCGSWWDRSNTKTKVNMGYKRTLHILIQWANIHCLDGLDWFLNDRRPRGSACVLQLKVTPLDILLLTSSRQKKWLVRRADVAKRNGSCVRRVGLSRLNEVICLHERKWQG